MAKVKSDQLLNAD